MKRLRILLVAALGLHGAFLIVGGQWLIVIHSFGLDSGIEYDPATLSFGAILPPAHPKHRKSSGPAAWTS